MKKYSLFALLSVAVALPAAGQFGGPPGRPGGPGLHGFERQELVTGAPYSATVTNTIVEHLADGNIIQRSTTGQMARDNQGRTYEQQTIQGGPLAEGGPKTLTFISDPVGGYSYVLDATRKIAFRRPFRSPGVRPDRQFQHGASNDPNVVISDLQPDSTTGVPAEGKSITRTIPAGAIGNAQPLVSTVQRWYSPDLKLVVKSIRNDARFGQATYALSNISRNEPDPTLFQVPAGYAVKDAPVHGPGDFHGRQ